MTSTREQLIQGVRECVMLALTLTDSKVIPADDTGPRPALPYITVQVVGAGEILGRESVLSTSGANATSRQRAWRRTRATLRAYGPESDEYIELFTLRLARDDVYTESVTRGISLEPLGPAVNATLTRDTLREEVTVQDFDLLYQITDETAAQTTSAELAEVTVALTLDRGSDDPSPLSVDVAVDM